MGRKKCLTYNDKKIMEQCSSAGKRVMGRNRIILDSKYYQSKKFGEENNVNGMKLTDSCMTLI
jgi:hypothetical protein